MTDASKGDCGWGSCDPSLYKTPNGRKIVIKEAGYLDQMNTKQVIIVQLNTLKTHIVYIYTILYNITKLNIVLK